MQLTEAEIIYQGGPIYTGVPSQPLAHALAVKEGLLLAVGDMDLVKEYRGQKTKVIDLLGNTIIPGIVDAHLHPMWGAKLFNSFSLKNEPLRVPELLDRLRDFLKASPQKDGWLKVCGWSRVDGPQITFFDLDQVSKERPIILFSSDCHFVAVNSRGLALLNLSPQSPQPRDGKFGLDQNGRLTGVFEDGPAMRLYDYVTDLSVDFGINLLKRAQWALNREGVTTILDARARAETLNPVKLLEKRRELTLRYFGAPEITPEECPSPELAEKAIFRVQDFFREFSEDNFLKPVPSVVLRHLKVFLDGMPTTLTAYSEIPFYEKEDNGAWQLGKFQAQPRFSLSTITALFQRAVMQNIIPHAHVIADGAAALGISALREARKKFPNQNIRGALAHLDIVTPKQYREMAEIGAIAVLSFQWGGVTEKRYQEIQNLYGPERTQGFETHGKFFDAGVTVAYGSDWPVDPLAEWRNFQIGLTRQIPESKTSITPTKNHPRLDNDRNLTLAEVLQAATINGAVSLGALKWIGTLERGKFADFAVISGNLFQASPQDIGSTRVLQTLVGGKLVYDYRVDFAETLNVARTFLE
ncbi:MAG: amidohydrolase [Deltaproteobacteria bacterium]|jgi:predicted amidohydrolase YtcJ|nr:amidohydrolase [Deltaproteobacteria bacterium]